MRVGILTYHRAHNFGAVLQCFALKSVIENMGHDVQVIDYRQPIIELVYQYHNRFDLRTLLRLPFGQKIDYIFNHISRYKKNYNNRKAYFESFCRKNLNLSPDYTSGIPDVYDIYVIGSDMLWGAECMMGHFESVYFGLFPHAKEHSVIGYAISSTPASIEKIYEETHFGFITEFKALSLRESKLASKVTQYTNRMIPVCLDPTLLTNSDTWEPLINHEWGKRKYILTYYLRVKSDDRSRIHDLLKRFTKEGYEIINIDLRVTSEPIEVEEFLSMIKYASYLITDSFHGVVFSTIFHTPVHAICLHDHGDIRYTNILEALGLTQLIVERDFTPDIPYIDYANADKQLINMQKDSMDFLKENL